ncbi:MAG: 4-(cytidine 5'-diphospho)-2-C-methyl-D-erythritol kinase [Cyanobacteriota bacterium]
MGSVGPRPAPRRLSSVQLDAPAKVNLHLEVLGLRPDGFHELAMVMQTIDLADQLTLECLPRGDLRLTLDSTTGPLPLDGDNLILKAAEALRREVGRPDLGAAIHLYKRIPIGAGLAGGSSDAAAALRGLCTLWQLPLAMKVLERLAAAIGSDVPFCLRGGTQLCFGRGERLEPIPDLPPLGVLLLKDSGVSVATPWAYSLCRQRLGAEYGSDEAAFEPRRQALRQRFRQSSPWPRADQPQALHNDLQRVVAPEVPSVRAGLERLVAAPGLRALAMSGSGPTLFGLFDDLEAARCAAEDLRPAAAAAGLQTWTSRFRAAIPPHTASSR